MQTIIDSGGLKDLLKHEAFLKRIEFLKKISLKDFKESMEVQEVRYGSTQDAVDQVPDSAAVRKLVADNPGLIGYIDRDALDASVKPVLVVR